MYNKIPFDIKYNFPKNIAIVGCGPSEIGTGNGTVIDSFDKVLRMNNFVISPKYANDYGTKVDYWCHCAWPGVKPRTENFERVFVPSASLNLKVRPIKYYKKITTIIPRQYIIDLKKLMRKLRPERPTSPSVGLNMVYWIFREQGNYINPDCLFGFSHFDKTIGYWDYYDPTNKYYKNVKKPAPHDGSVQKTIFNYMINYKQEPNK